MSKEPRTMSDKNYLNDPTQWYMTPPIEIFPYEVSLPDIGADPFLNMFLQQEAMRYINQPRVKKLLVQRTLDKYKNTFRNS